MTPAHAVPGAAGPDLVDRSKEAAQVAAAIVAAESPTVVLHGRAGSGKTELIKRWLIPTLRGKGLVAWYGECDQGLPAMLEGPEGLRPFQDALATDAIVVLDGFARVLDLPGEERRATLAQLSGRMQGRGACLVLVVDTRQLTSVYALGGSEPGLANVVLDLGSVSLADGLLELSASDPAQAVHYQPDLLRALSEEAQHLEQQGPGITLDLIGLLDAQFRRIANGLGGRPIDLHHFLRVLGGISGILRSHLEERLTPFERERPGGGEMARAVLEWAAGVSGRTGAGGVGEIAPRLGVEPAELEALLARLMDREGLLRRAAAGNYELVPPQLAVVLAEDAARREEVQNKRARQLVDASIGGWQLLGNLPSPERFADIHRARIHLTLEPDEVHFLLLCALRYGEGAMAEAPRYWLRRLSGSGTGTDVLLAALSDQDAGVRLRAAALLREAPAPRVGHRLLAAALTDVEPSVRAQAVASLQAMPDDDLMTQVIREARNPGSAYRAQAIQALAAFPSQQGVSVLQSLVNERGTAVELRGQAVAVLGTMSVPASVDALIDIALHDQDAEDRDGAAQALAVTGSEALNRRILAALRAPDVRPAVWLARAGLAAAAGIGFWLFYQTVESGEDTALGALILAGVPLAVLAGMLLRRMRSGRIARSSPLGIVGVVLFALATVAAFTWIHGLAHAVVGRWKRAGLLLGVELLGLGLAWVAGVMSFLPGFDRLVAFYDMVAIFLFLGSYLWDVVATLFHTVVLTETVRLDQRRAAIGREVLGNPLAAGMVFSSLDGGDRAERRLAHWLLARFGERVRPELLMERLRAGQHPGLPLVVRALKRLKADNAATIPGLEALWRDASGAVRPVITRILAGRPDRRSLDALHRLWKEMGPAGRARTTLARLRLALPVPPAYVSAFVPLLLAPAAVLVFHGVNVLTNPGWSQVLMLGRPSFTVEQDEQIRAATILKQYYATGPQGGKIAAPLLRLLQSRSHSAQPAVRAAVVSALVASYDRGPVDSGKAAAIHDQLVVEASDFGRWLNQESRSSRLDVDSSPAALGPVAALGDMGAAADSVLADTALSILRAFVLAPSADNASDAWKAAAVRALGSVRYDRALPALDALSRDLNCTPDRATLCDGIRWQIDKVMVSVADSLYSESADGNCAADTRLLSVINRMRYRSPQSEEARRVAANATADRNGDGTCDRADQALRSIEDRPNAEYPYLGLRDYYLERGAYEDAARAMRDLKARYPGSLWPRKILANLYHEYLPSEDTLFFRRSYDEMVALRRLSAFLALADTAEDRVRIEADFAEIALSARRYRELETSARAVLRARNNEVYRYNLTLFRYFARVMGGNSDSAAAALDSLASVVRSLPAGFYNGWIYLGTEKFINRSHLPAVAKGALLGLCPKREWVEKAEIDSVLTANRAVLGMAAGRDR